MAIRTKKKLTAEQLEAQKQRAEKFRIVCKTIGDMSEDARLEMLRGQPILSVGGKPLSVYNSCLLIVQRANVTLVGGFQQWKSQGRKIRKGESGLMIWIPTGKKESATIDARQGEVVADASTGEVKRAGFIRGYVWDVSQTEEIVAGQESDSEGIDNE